MTAMLDHLIAEPGGPTAEIIALAADTLDGWLDGADGDQAAWVRANGFTAKPGAHCLLPGDGGRIAKVLLGIESSRDPWAYGGLPVALPEGDYHLARGLDADQANDAALGWALGGYRFTRYREATGALARLVWPAACDRGRIETLAFKGRAFNLHEPFRSPEFRAALEGLGVRLALDFNDETRAHGWHDYSEADLVLAVRDLTKQDALIKPASKLVNARIAGTPAILGPEPAFRDLRRSDLDYFEVRTPEDVLAAVRRLK